ncbi:MAG: heavy-metal-associated domain-containing protein [Weeksellaceae bacterium]|nr:heavy-metal-associated domain-containing protein [Weeksellaceae bacterium]
MKSNLSFIFLLLGFGLFFAQSSISNARTVSLAISGNCGMCKNKIEKAANQPAIAHLDWNQKTKTAKLTYDSHQTTPSQVMRKVAEVGYDNEFFLAKDEVYKNLHGCCLYDRNFKTKREAKKGDACCSADESAKSTKSCGDDHANDGAAHASKSNQSCCSGS